MCVCVGGAFAKSALLLQCFLAQHNTPLIYLFLSSDGLHVLKEEDRESKLADELCCVYRYIVFLPYKPCKMLYPK